MRRGSADFGRLTGQAPRGPKFVRASFICKRDADAMKSLRTDKGIDCKEACSAAILQEMEPLKVFISSVMRSNVDDLSLERKAAYEAIEALSPVACAWAFEKEPASTKALRDSYLDEVKTCDFLLLIVGRVITPAVDEEIMTARDYQKPILVFAKHVPERESQASEILRSIDAKRDVFADAAELRDKVRIAVGHEILRRARPQSQIDFMGPGDRMSRLRNLARARMEVRVSPLVPQPQRDLFSIEDLQPDIVTLSKSATWSGRIEIPVSRITEVLVLGTNDAPMIRLDGRLQWLTLAKNWKFFPERPAPADALGLGVPREVGRSDPSVGDLSALLHVVWSRRDMLAERLSAGTHAVFYDETGRYLVSGGAILMVSS